MSNTTGKTVAQRNRAIRQEALREQLAAGGHLQHVIDMASKLADLEGHNLEAIDVQRLNGAINAKMKIIDKYLPTVKPVELTGEDGGPVAVTRVELVPLSTG